MIEVLEFIFASFWRFAGTLVLLTVAVGMLAQVRIVTVHIERTTNNGIGE